MSLFDAMNAAGQAMSVFSYQTEVAGENATGAYAKQGHVHQEVDVESHPFTDQFQSANAASEASNAFATPASSLQVVGTRGVKMSQRQDAAMGVYEMLQAKTAYSTAAKVSSMLKSMALASLEIGRGS